MHPTIDRIVRDLSAAIVRANAAYSFVPLEGLSPEQRISITGQASVQSAVAGILAGAEGSGLSIKVLSDGSCELFKQLRVPAPVSASIQGDIASERDETAARLVLEGILEISTAHGFVSGVPAFQALFEDAAEARWSGTGRLAALSLAALRHGARMGIDGADTLAARMYFHNRLPATRRWLDLWPDSVAVTQYLDLAPGGALRQSLASSFRPSDSSPVAEDWLVWHRRGRGSQKRTDGKRYKLYVSPVPEDLRAAFHTVVHLLPSSEAASFKIGPNAHGLLRPDKMIVYFDSYEDLERFSVRLLPEMTAIRAQGVPFTGQIDELGLLSWGLDPPRNGFPGGTYVDDSWRIWICNRLAAALLPAKRSADRREVSKYALAALWLAGVDPRTWTPRPFHAGSPIEAQ